jgi:hypothetical protein
MALNTLFGHTYERRLAEWAERLVELINHLAALTGRTAEELAADPVFFSAVVTASQIAIGQHVEEKLEMLKSVLAHSVLEPDRPDVITMRYLRWVDELDVEHVQVMRYSADPKGWYEAHGRALTHVSSRTYVMDHAGLDVSSDLLPIVLSDLSNRGLAATGMLSGMVSTHATYDPWITPLGADWLRWITTV